MDTPNCSQLCCGYCLLSLPFSCLLSVQLPSPWILSPIKGSNKAAAAEPHFLEMTFSEDEEDEEYKPSEDELKVRGHALVAQSGYLMLDSPAVLLVKPYKMWGILRIYGTVWFCCSAKITVNRTRDFGILQRRDIQWQTSRLY